MLYAAIAIAAVATHWITANAQNPCSEDMDVGYALSQGLQLVQQRQLCSLSYNFNKLRNEALTDNFL
jgi:hypothetical protein